MGRRSLKLLHQRLATFHDEYINLSKKPRAHTFENKAMTILLCPSHICYNEAGMKKNFSLCLMERWISGSRPRRFFLGKSCKSFKMSLELESKNLTNQFRISLEYISLLELNIHFRVKTKCEYLMFLHIRLYSVFIQFTITPT